MVKFWDKQQPNLDFVAQFLDFGGPIDAGLYDTVVYKKN